MLSLFPCSPEWYKLLAKDLAATSSKQTLQEENNNSLSLLQTEQSSSKEDEFVEEEIISLSSSSTEESAPRSTVNLDNTNEHSKWNSKKQIKGKLLSVRLFMNSEQQTQNLSAEVDTLPSSGIITAKSPPPNLELPLITDGFRRSFTFSAPNRRKELVSMCLW